VQRYAKKVGVTIVVPYFQLWRSLITSTPARIAPERRNWPAFGPITLGAFASQKNTQEPSRIVRCTGDEDTLRIEEYESDYCTDSSPSSTFTITKDECTNYRDRSGTLYKRTASWSYTGGLICPSGDVNIGVKKYGAAGCESNPSSEWVEIIPRLGQCFNSTTPNLGANIRRSVECSGSTGTITEYTDTNDPFQNCTAQATSFEISNGDCIEWTDPTNSATKEYRRMYFDCSTNSSTAFVVFWVVLVAILQY